MISLSLLPYIVFVSVVIAEIFSPRNPDSTSNAKRWVASASFYVISLIVGRAFFILVAAIGISVFDSDSHESNVAVAFITVVGTILLFDFVDYLKHRLYHGVPVLWRIHQVHHNDPKLDFSTAFRFHPIEMLVSISVDIILIVSFNIPSYALAIYGGLAYFSGLVTHSNTALFNSVDRLLRAIWVTPNMHHIHHSTNTEHYNKNFGVILSFWDRLFNSYCTLSSKDISVIEYGVIGQTGRNELNIGQLILLPFKAKSL
jgi:sterol desaturase/sphingolipid hydroxylase (fatty acid hydroxylase superfamily)